MTTTAIEIKQSIDPEDLALALNQLEPEQITAFARELMQRLYDLDDSLVDAFHEGVTSEQALREFATA